MVWFAQGLLILWPVIVLALFERQTVRKAIVFCFVGGWLFLPPIVFSLPAIPDWGKVTATVASVLLAAFLKQPGRLLGFVPRWFDWPMLAFCTCSIPTSITSGVGLYEGLAATLDDFMWWGFPYLIGRTYLGDRAGARQLAAGIAVGGLIYVPLCLIEIRISPILKTLVYGVSSLSMSDFGMRYGGYRPAVFLAMGLEVGWWMCCATLCAFLLVASRSTRRWFDLPAVPLTWFLAAVTVACKSTGALSQLAIGGATIAVCRMTKKSLPFYLIVFIAPTYCVTRASGLCSGAQITSMLGHVFPAERIQSMEFRLGQEDFLSGMALQYPVLGWSRLGNFNPEDRVVIDSYWIRVFCTKGIVGITLFNLIAMVPTLLFLRQNPVRTWLTPEIAPLLALATILPLYMMDNLSNAMLNPIYPVAMGILSGCAARREGGRVPSRDEGLGEDAERARLVEAIRDQERAVHSRPHARNIGELATLRARYGRLLAVRGLVEEALAERTAAEELWRSVEPPSGAGGPWPAERAANANDLAWLLAAAPEATPDRLARARHLVEAALAGEQARAPFWNTLGLICYRQGDHHRAIHALSRSVTLGSDGGTAFDFYFLALANRALGYEAASATWRDRAESWHHDHPELDPALAEIRAEVDGVAP